MGTKRKKSPPIDPKQWWVCEKCLCHWEGKDPPDECDYCGYRYLDNLFDLNPNFGQEVQ